MLLHSPGREGIAVAGLGPMEDVMKTRRFPEAEIRHMGPALSSADIYGSFATAR